jgi:CRP-like cAMP-binding protein
MDSYESNINERMKKGEKLPDRLDISLLKFFWQTSIVARNEEGHIPKFLKKIEVLKNFSENELRILSKFMHVRSFSPKEVIFSKSDLGVGFYFVFNGLVDIFKEEDTGESRKLVPVITLEKLDYFGELALLQKRNTRNVFAISRDGCELIGIFKPDVDDLIQQQPVIAAKLLQSISLVVASRLYSITKEVERLKFRVKQLENSKD